ncbi:MAG: hypothetical protein ACKPKO_34085, partial [Candidatus Fonsibacter sp.]
MVLHTQARKQDPDKKPFPQYGVKERHIETRKRKYDRANHKGLLQYWTGHLTVEAYNDRAINQQKEKLTTRGTNEFKLLYRICTTDSRLSGRNLHSRLDGDRRCRRSICPRRLNKTEDIKFPIDEAL